ncbi:sensor histidine kinase [Sphaerochaeta pleomorpha]|nr:histidine kinase [Sphaerochaeta pleomorpha]
MPIRLKVTLTSVLIATVVAVVASITFFYAIKNITQKTFTTNLEALQTEIEQILVSDMVSIDNTARHIIQSASVFNYLSNGSLPSEYDEYELFSLKSAMGKDISRQLFFNPAFESGLIQIVRLFLEKDIIITQTKKATEQNLNVSSDISTYQYLQESGNTGRQVFVNEGRLSFAYPISSLSGVRKPTALIIGCNVDQFKHRYDALVESFSSAVYAVYDQNGLMLFSYGDLGSISQNYKVKTNKLSNGFISTIAVSNKELTGKVSDITFKYLLFFLALMPIPLLAAFFMTRRMRFFAENFIKHIKRVGEGDFAVTLPVYGDDELDEIGKAFNTMTGKINSLVEEVYKKQFLIQQMKIQLLQNQMNPHFLFNVLFSMSTRAKMNRDETLYQMTVLLSKFLRTNIASNDSMMVPIKSEMDYVDTYLNIQAMRFGDRLAYEWQIPRELMDCYCPRLSIQPLVENSVMHGIEPLTRTGHIVISVSDEKDFIIVTVEDDGVGFDMSLSEDRKDGRGNHIALDNLRQRLRLLYGDECTLRMESAVGMGCTASFRIPKQREEQKDVIPNIIG